MAEREVNTQRKTKAAKVQNSICEHVKTVIYILRPQMYILRH